MRNRSLVNQPVIGTATTKPAMAEPYDEAPPPGLNPAGEMAPSPAYQPTVRKHHIAPASSLLRRRILVAADTVVRRTKNDDSHRKRDR
jgi:hypothetical protein